MSVQINSQTNSQVKDKYNLCLVITRHKLVKAQEEDIKSMCNQYVIELELPINQQQLKEFVKNYDAIIGVFPIQLEIQILENKKALVTFVMESLGVVDDKQQAEEKASKYPDRAVILTPSKPGEKYRVVLYKGMKLVKEIRVVDEWLVQYPS